MNMRWVLKRAGKWALEWGMTVSGAGRAYRRTRYFRKGFRILTYHAVQPTPDDSYTVSTEHFRMHVAYLSDHYPVVDLASLTRGLQGTGPLEPEAVALTFDDGYSECATYVAEILERHRAPATFFLVTEPLDTGKPVGGRSLISWDEARHMAKAGFSFGSHTVRHRSLALIPLSEAEEELAVSRLRIEQELGIPPDAVSYPYGTRRDVSPQIADLARRMGYSCAVTASHGLNHPDTDPFLLKRTTLTAGDGPRTFRMIMRGCLDPWCLVDRWGYRLQRWGGDRGF